MYVLHALKREGNVTKFSQEMRLSFPRHPCCPSLHFPFSNLHEIPIHEPFLDTRCSHRPYFQGMSRSDDLFSNLVYHSQLVIVTLVIEFLATSYPHLFRKHYFLHEYLDEVQLHMKHFCPILWYPVKWHSSLVLWQLPTLPNKIQCIQLLIRLLMERKDLLILKNLCTLPNHLQ